VRSANYTAYSNPEMDKLLDAGVETLDPAKRKDVYRQIAELLAKDVPYAFLFEANFFSISSSKVKGIEPVPDGLIRLRNVWLNQ
jgi:peptide/nickel transport system substrate-binding protein